MSQLRQQQARFAELNVKVKIVSFDHELMAQKYVQANDLKWPVLLDSDQKMFAAYDMLAGSWWAIFNPLSIAAYIALICRGIRPGKPGKDWRQLGGNVLIDPEGIIRLHHASIGPHDRPSVSEIFGPIVALNSQ